MERILVENSSMFAALYLAIIRVEYDAGPASGIHADRRTSKDNYVSGYYSVKQHDTDCHHSHRIHCDCVQSKQQQVA